MWATPCTFKAPLALADPLGMKNKKNNFRDRITSTASAPLGHSFDLVDRRVIELWLGSQTSSFPSFGPSAELRGFQGEVKPSS